MQIPIMKAVRIHREFTADEAVRYAEVLRHVESEKAEIIARGRELLNRHQAAMAKVRSASLALKAERERQGISLEEIENRSGIDREQLSQIENKPGCNLEAITLVRYAEALGKNLSIELINK
jgi:hypothetical protein